MTDTPTLTLTDFLLARIAEDEAVARDWPEDTFGKAPSGGLWLDTRGRPIYAPRSRVLAECEAKRRIVERPKPACGGFERQAETGGHHYPDPDWAYCDGCASASDADADQRWVLGVLATVYADHPDFRPEWRP